MFSEVPKVADEAEREREREGERERETQKLGERERRVFEPFEGLFNGEEEWLARLGKNEKEGKKD